MPISAEDSPHGPSVRAVEKHASSVFTKLGVTEEPDANRRVRAVLMYLDEQGQEPEPTP